MTQLYAFHLQADKGNHIVRSINLTTSVVLTIAGRATVRNVADGYGTSAFFSNPSGVMLDAGASFAMIVRACVLGFFYHSSIQVIFLTYLLSLIRLIM